MTPLPRQRLASFRPRSLAFLASALLATLVPATSAFAAPGGRPDFELPFTCGEKWQLTTYTGHGDKPYDKRIDMFHVGGPTAGSAVVASAPGVVHEKFDPGGLEIDHGNGWFTVYLHMNARVAVGTRVKQGQRIGTVGSVGTHVSHLHYEQLFDSNHDHDGENNEIVNPTIQGTEYHLSPSMRPFPTVTSNNCGNSPPPGGGTTSEPRKYRVDTFAAATGWSAPTCVDAESRQCQANGTLYAAPDNYVFCKKLGSEIRDGSQYNHWWLLTDLDEVRPGKSHRAWVSAFYLRRWGNNEARDNDGNEIPDC